MFSKFRNNRKAGSGPSSPQAAITSTSTRASPNGYHSDNGKIFSSSPLRPDVKSPPHTPLPSFAQSTSSRNDKPFEELQPSAFGEIFSQPLEETTSAATLNGEREREGRGRVDNGMKSMPELDATEQSSTDYRDFALCTYTQPSSDPQFSAPNLTLPIRQTRPSHTGMARSASSGNILLDSCSAGTSSTTPKLSKARNLLNPRGLLSRRRTAHGLDTSSEELFGSKPYDVLAMTLPDDYDPRIIGRGVHDFSAPRSTRTLSSNDVSSIVTQAGPLEPTEFARRSSIPMLSLPEQDEPAQSTALDGSRVSSVDNNLDVQSFLANSNNVDTMTAPSEDVTRAEQSMTTRYVSHQPMTSVDRASDSTGVPSTRISADRSTMRSELSINTRSTSPARSPERQRPDSATMPVMLSQSLRHRKHASSSASHTSRFSFQLNSDRSIELERAMEGKHDLQSPSSANQGKTHSASDSDTGSDFSVSSNDLHDDDLHEEAIPGVNTNECEDEALSYTTPKVLPVLMSLSEANSSESRASEDMHEVRKPLAKPDVEETMLQEHILQPQDNQLLSSTRSVSPLGEDADDMYFDDGHIVQIQDDISESFDEDVLDTMSGPALDRYEFGRSALAARHPQLTSKATLLSSKFYDTAATSNRGADTSYSIDAYHGALASAASRAAADGKFQRVDSLGIAMTEGTPVYEANEGSSYNNTSRAYAHHDEVEHGWDDDNDDIELEGDDSMIAAANAEALEADDAGFYGREFGFYSRAGAGEAASFAGGYFNAEAVDARNRNVVRDPNLTPITERSEFSRVNSFVGPLPGGTLTPSLGLLSSSVPREPLPSPGLKELAARMNNEEDDLTLDQLMKLRKGAFGGASQSSHGGSSLSGSPVMLSSPLVLKTSLPVRGAPRGNVDLPRLGANMPHMPPTSSLNPILETSKIPYKASSASAAGEAAMAVPLPSPSQLQKFAARPPASSTTPAMLLSPLKLVQQQQQQQQSARTGDSVTYVREELENGQEQWYLEKRRTLASGEIIVLGKESVEGGRI